MQTKNIFFDEIARLMAIPFLLGSSSIAALSAVYNKPYDIPDFKSYAVTSEDLDNYLGIYSAKEFPLKITITKEGATLIAQATDQPSFLLKATDKDIFKFDQAGIVLEFNPTAKTMILK
jgi:hypothetical protein